MLPFASAMLLAGAAAAIPVAAIGDQDPAITISNAGHTATHTGANVGAYAFGSSGKTTGKWRFQVTCDNGTGDFSIGLSGGLFLRSSFLGSDTNGIALNVTQTVGELYNNTTQYQNLAGPIAAGVVIDVYVDLDAATPRAWFARNGVMLDGNPAAGTGGTAIGAMRKAVYPTLYMFAQNAAFTFNFGDSAFTYAGVAGFNAWSAAPPPVSLAQFRTFAMLIRSPGWFGHGWAETELMTTAGGANMLAGSTATGSIAPFQGNAALYGAPNTIDANTTTFITLQTTTAQNQGPVWVAYELAANAARNTAFMAIRGRDGGGGAAQAAPTLFDLWVSDGTTATGAFYKVKLGIQLAAFVDGTPGERKQFAL